MGESKLQQIKKKMLQARFDKLEQEYTALSEQLNYTDNAAVQEQRKRQLKDIENKMLEVEQELNSLLQSEITPHPLVQILSPNADSIITHIKKAYQACCPEGFSQQPDTVEGILEILQDIRGDNPQFVPIARFVAHLVIDSNIPKALRDELQKWGENNIKDFNQLRQDLQKDNNSDIQEANSYLVIRVKPKTKKIDRFYISAWLIPDIRCYKPQKYDGFQTLDVSKSSTKTFTLGEIPQIVESLLNQSSSYVLRNLTVEFFLPSQLLNHEVDSFIKKEFNYAETIGKKYRVFVRANERLEKNYPYKGLWYDKWQKLKQAYNCQCRQELVSKNYTLEVLRKKLDKAIGLIFIKVPETTSHEKFFSLLLITATPIALWLRKEIKVQAVVKNSLLDCCILELPEKVKEKRLDAPQDNDDHVGHHLSLVWEDPERLTPDAEYFYSLPQSVS